MWTAELPTECGCGFSCWPCELLSQLNCIVPGLVLPLIVTWPVPLASKSKSTFVSPVDDNLGAAPLAAFAIVNSFTAEPVAVNKANSFPLVSKIEVPILGEVKVLFVKVCVPESVKKDVVSTAAFWKDVIEKLLLQLKRVKLRSI